MDPEIAGKRPILRTRQLRLLAALVALVAAAWSVTAVGQAPTTGVTVFEGARVIVGDGRVPIENATFVVSGAVSAGRHAPATCACRRARPA